MERADTLDAASGASTSPGEKKRVRTRIAFRLSLVEGVDTLDAFFDIDQAGISIFVKIKF